MKAGPKVAVDPSPPTNAIRSRPTSRVDASANLPTLHWPSRRLAWHGHRPQFAKQMGGGLGAETPRLC